MDQNVCQRTDIVTSHYISFMAVNYKYNNVYQ